MPHNSYTAAGSTNQCGCGCSATKSSCCKHNCVPTKQHSHQCCSVLHSCYHPFHNVLLLVDAHLSHSCHHIWPQCKNLATTQKVFSYKLVRVCSILVCRQGHLDTVEMNKQLSAMLISHMDCLLELSSV